MDLSVSGEEGFAEQATGDFSQNWTLHKNWLQGVDIGRLVGIFENSNKKSIYKLAVKNVWGNEGIVDFESQGVKGALGLVKATWSGSKKWDIKEETVDENNKVWLIVAKSKGAMYLMPVVRSSGRCELFDTVLRKAEIEDAKKEIEKQGVNDIGTWTKKFDGREEWLEGKDEELQKAMGSGFSITSRVEAIIFGGGVIGYGKGGRSNEEHSLERFLGEAKTHGNTWGTRIEYLYKNAGELTFDGGWKDDSHYCYKRERYFPLDLVVLGDSSTVKRKGAEYTGLNQTIKITDEITDVIGVRLDPKLP